MAMANSILSFSPSCPSRIEVKSDKARRLNFAVQAKGKAVEPRKEGGGGGGRQIWRRRKLKKEDIQIKYKEDRVPFLEEQVRKIREEGKLVTVDIARLMLRENNRFEFVNDVAAEARECAERNRDKYGAKKAIYHAISNRINDTFGLNRPEAYFEEDPFKPGPGYVRDEMVDKIGGNDL